MNRGAHTS